MATSACGASPPGARDTVDLYFRCLGRDPIRSLAILSPDFQLAHRLRLGAPLAPGASADPLAAAQVAWLNVQKTAAFQQQARRLSTRWIQLREDGDTARASLRVRAGESPGFAQRFQLSPEQRAAVLGELRDDLRRLRDEHGFDISGWGLDL